MSMEKIITRRTVLAAGAALIAAPSFIDRAQAAKTPVLVELFTSQGCSSCPAADSLMGEMAKRNDLIIVSENVDYWDYLGWKDTLARPEYTKRQMDYAKSRGDGDVYTPQVVVNGSLHAVGSQKSSVEAAIAKAQQADVAIGLDATKDEVVINVPDGDGSWHGTLWIMAIEDRVDVKVERGENSGQSLSYHNIVRQMTPAGMYKGKAMSLVLPRDTVASHQASRCVAVLQEGMTGQVRGLALYRMKTAS
jgi:hypothetical protein